MQKIFQPFLLAASLLLTSLPGARAQGAGSTASGRADETGKAPVSTTRTMEAYGRAYPYCREWSDNCQVCLSGDDGRIVCSTVAIACVQKPIECRSLRWSLPANGKAGKDATGQESGGQESGGKK